MNDNQDSEHKKDDSAQESRIKTENSAASDEVKRSIFAAFGSSSFSPENPINEVNKNAARNVQGSALR